MNGCQKTGEVNTGGVPFNFGVELTVTQLPLLGNRSQIISSPYKGHSRTANFFVQ